MALPVYSSRDVVVALGGQTLTGLSPDSFVTFAFNTDRTDEEVGSDGQLAISIMADRTGTCTISLQQTSESNLVLSGVLNTQEATGTLVRANLTISDPSGSVFATLHNCHLKTAPEVTLGNTATGATRDWVFYAERLTYTSTPPGLVSDDAARIQSAVDTIISNI